MGGRRLLAATAAVLLLSACEDRSVVMTGPAVEELWAGPEVVATPDELSELSRSTTDPLVLDVTGSLPGELDQATVAALQTFGVELMASPGPSFGSLEATLDSMYGENGAALLDADAALVRQTIDLYRDHASMTLFGVDREALPPLAPGR